MSPTDPRHGTRRGYYAHRRAGENACAACKRAAAGAEARYKMLHAQGIPSRVSPVGLRRRLRALVALGWTFRALDRGLGYNNMVDKWVYGDDLKYVYAHSHQRVAALYERLSMTLPPENTQYERGSAAKARNIARRRGWLPPLAWNDIDDPNEAPATIDWPRDLDDCDQAVVERVLGGDWRLPSTDVERTEIARRWYASGRSLSDLERLTGFKPDRYFHVRDGKAA